MTTIRARREDASATGMSSSCLAPGLLMALMVGGCWDSPTPPEPAGRVIQQVLARDAGDRAIADAVTATRADIEVTRDEAGVLDASGGASGDGSVAMTPEGSDDRSPVCEGAGLRAAIFSPEMVRSPGNRLALIDVVSDEGPLLVTDRVADRSYTGRKYRLRVRAQVAADASRLPETVDVNVHAESFQHGSSLGRATLTTPDGVHEVRVGQRMLALLVDDPVDPGHLRAGRRRQNRLNS